MLQLLIKDRNKRTRWSSEEFRHRATELLSIEHEFPSCDMTVPRPDDESSSVNVDYLLSLTEEELSTALQQADIPIPTGWSPHERLTQLIIEGSTEELSILNALNHEIGLEQSAYEV